MSNFDPRSPSYVPPGGTVELDGSGFNYKECNQTAETILAAGTVLSATTAYTLNNIGCKGAYFFLYVDSLPASGSTTVALKVQIFNAANRRRTIGALTAISASVDALLLIAPGVGGASVGAVSSAINASLPRTFQVRLSLSTGATSKDVALSLDMMRVL
jgi:hypothetical protein